MCHSPWSRGGVWRTLLLGLLAATAAMAQSDPTIAIKVQPEDIGLGVLRLGTWTPMHVTIEHQGTRPRQVIAEWVIDDIDGDLVESRRTLTLQPRNTSRVWLYAEPRVSTQKTDVWYVRVRDAQTGQILATHSIAAGQTVPPFAGAVGILGVELLGLQNFRDRYTQHETNFAIRDLKPRELPDRWYGLSVFDMLVWTPRAGDPTAGDVQNQVKAIRDWVQRGGHLVIIMSSVADPWSDPQVSDLVPPVKLQQVSDLSPPDWLLPPIMRPDDRTAIKSMQLTGYVLEPDITRGGAHVVLRDDAQRPIVVARQVGFGRVTLIGLDMTDPRLTRLGCPMPESTFWRSVAGWQSPGFSGTDVKKMVDATNAAAEETMLSYAGRNATELARGLVDSSLGMQGNAFGSLVMAVFLFALYWLIAALISFIVLKANKRSHLSWVVFVIIVLGFSVVSWGMAYFFRPQRTGVQHFTVLTGDSSTGVVHTHSWFSLMVPYHGRAEVEVQPDENIASSNTLASAGHLPSLKRAGFLDEQRYTIDAGAPTAMSAPMRATSKQFEADYLGKPVIDAKGEQPDWSFPKGTVKRVNGQLTGTLTHNLPGTLTELRVVYCPGEGKVPVFWKPGPDVWAANTPFDLGALELRTSQELVVPRDLQYGAKRAYFVRHTSFTNRYLERQWVREGYLGKIQQNAIGSGDVNAVMALTFYDLLPPPEFVKTGKPGQDDFSGYPGLTGSATEYRRSAGRPFNLSALTAMPTLIVLGRLDTQSGQAHAMPTPVTIDGDPVRCEGRTMVRWVFPLD